MRSSAEKRREKENFSFSVREHRASASRKKKGGRNLFENTRRRRRKAI
jgi:hypothetical protein